MKIQIVKLSDKYAGMIDSEYHDNSYIRCSDVSCDSGIMCCDCPLDGKVKHRSELEISEIEL